MAWSDFATELFGQNGRTTKDEVPGEFHEVARFCPGQGGSIFPRKQLMANLHNIRLGSGTLCAGPRSKNQCGISRLPVPKSAFPGQPQCEEQVAQPRT